MTKRAVLLGAIFVLAALVATLHFLALEYYLYWIFPWFDVLVHFLGGLLVGVGALWIFFYSEYPLPFQLSKKYALAVVLMSVVGVGVGWEVFEFLADIPRASDYVLDTSIDLLMDVVGGVAGHLALKGADESVPNAVVE